MTIQTKIQKSEKLRDYFDISDLKLKKNIGFTDIEIINELTGSYARMQKMCFRTDVLTENHVLEAIKFLEEAQSYGRQCTSSLRMLNQRLRGFEQRATYTTKNGVPIKEKNAVENININKHLKLKIEYSKLSKRLFWERNLPKSEQNKIFARMMEIESINDNVIILPENVPEWYLNEIYQANIEAKDKFNKNNN